MRQAGRWFMQLHSTNWCREKHATTAKPLHLFQGLFGSSRAQSTHRTGDASSTDPWRFFARSKFFPAPAAFDARSSRSPGPPPQTRFDRKHGPNPLNSTGHPIRRPPHPPVPQAVNASLQSLADEDASMLRNFSRAPDSAAKTRCYRRPIHRPAANTVAPPRSQCARTWVLDHLVPDLVGVNTSAPRDRNCSATRLFPLAIPQRFQ
jgi:hypothetical protein